MNSIPINYYPLSRSGCSLRRDAEIDAWHKRDKRIYGPIASIGAESITLFCAFGWDNLNDIPGKFQLFLVNEELDYNSFNSLN